MGGGGLSEDREIPRKWSHNASEGRLHLEVIDLSLGPMKRSDRIFV